MYVLARSIVSFSCFLTLSLQHFNPGVHIAVNKHLEKETIKFQALTIGTILGPRTHGNTNSGTRGRRDSNRFPELKSSWTAVM